MRTPAFSLPERVDPQGILSVSAFLFMEQTRAASTQQAPVFLVLSQVSGPHTDQWLGQAKKVRSVVDQPPKRSGVRGILSHAYAKPERHRYPRRDKEWSPPGPLFDVTVFFLGLVALAGYLTS